MSWTRTCFIRAATASLVFFAAGAVAAETIVVRSAGPSARAYPPGKNLPDNSKVTLKRGDSVVILDGRGTREFKGPGTFSTTTATATSTSIGSVLRNTGQRQVRTGAVRGVGSQVGVTRPPNVWLINASQSGTVCYAGTEDVSLWVPARTEASTLTVTRIADGKAMPIAMRPGQSVKAWPVADFPVKDGAQFRISDGGTAQPVLLRFAALGPNPQGLEATAAALIRKGCTAQLDLLIETVAVPASGESAGN